MSSKQELRKWAKDKRKELNTLELSEILLSKFRSLNEYKQAQNIMLYYPLVDEINLLALVNDKNKSFYLPKINDKELLCCPYQKGDELCPSCFKTMEPVTKSVESKIMDVIIVPALCVDKNNYRLGYGGGFYDRFLKNCNAKTVVCISKQLILDTIYPEEFDIPIDLIVTA